MQKLFFARHAILNSSAAHLLAVAMLSAVSTVAGMSRGKALDDANIPAEAQHGKQLFEKRCTGCHSLDEDREGPRLRNVYGRSAGSIATFRYSDALKSARFRWNDALLDRWLASPDSLAKDTDMNFSVPRAEERAAIIRYLRLSSGK